MSKEINKFDSVEQVTVSTSVLANLFGISTRRIRQLETEGIINKVARGKYSLQENIKSYITFLKTTVDLKENKGEESKIDYDEEHTLLEKAKREKAELEVAAIRGTMHFSEDVESVMTDMLSNFKSKALSLPSRAAPNLVMKDVADIQDVLQGEVLELLHELSDYNPEDFYNEKYIQIDGLSEEDQ